MIRPLSEENSNQWVAFKLFSKHGCHLLACPVKSSLMLRENQ